MGSISYEIVIRILVDGVAHMPGWLRKYFGLMILLIAIIVGMAVVILRMDVTEPNAPKLTMGLVIPGTAEDLGWNSEMFTAAKSVATKRQSQIIYIQRAGKDVALQAIEELRKQDVSPIILGSQFLPAELTDDLASAADTMFIGFTSLSRHVPNYSGLSPRIYQTCFMAGYTAATSSKSGAIGFISGVDGNFSRLNINAFTLGARQARADIRVYATHTGSWYDTKASRQAVAKLVDSHGVDVIAYALATDGPALEARMRHLYYIGFLNDTADKGHVMMLARMNVKFSRLIDLALSGKGLQISGSGPRFCGFENGCVGFDRFSNSLKADLVNRLSLYERELKNGYGIFMDELLDSEGNLRCTEGSVLSDYVLAAEMTWYVSGVTLVP